MDIFNLSAKEVWLLLRSGSVTLIEPAPAGWDDDQPLRVPAEPLMLCIRGGGDQYCLSAAPGESWQPMAACRVRDIQRRDITRLEEGEARSVLEALPLQPAGCSYASSLAHYWRGFAWPSDQVILFRLELERPPVVPADEGQMPAQTAKPLQLWWGILGVSLLIAAAILGRLQ